jgi:cobalt-zinc-cadmium efflux system outer membrane protein
MRRNDSLASGWIVFGLAFASCATVVDPQADFAAARAQVQATTGIATTFDPRAPLLSEEQLREHFEDGLTLDEALALALTNNRRLQAGFLELGVGRADFVQAGLLRNPNLSLSFLWPSGGGAERFGASLLGSVADLWQLRQRERFARLSQDHRLLDLSRFAGELVFDTQSAYFETLAAAQTRAVAEQNLALSQSMLASVRRQVELGVATKTDEGLAHGRVLDAELALRRQAETESAGKQRLASLLSVELESRAIVLTSALPDPNTLDPLDEALVARGKLERIHLKAARLELEAAEAQVRVERSRRFPEASAGPTVERPEVGSSTSFVSGVAAELEVPIFDQNQAQIARAEHRRDALKKEFEALTYEVASEVRAAADRTRVAWDVASFAERELLPQAERNAALAQRAYELGDATALQALEAQQQVLHARQATVEARLELFRARLELERSVGAPLERAIREPRPAE